jgi:hypothetical protein
VLENHPSSFDLMRSSHAERMAKIVASITFETNVQRRSNFFS